MLPDYDSKFKSLKNQMLFIKGLPQKFSLQGPGHHGVRPVPVSTFSLLVSGVPPGLLQR